jgi:hypothetical protein
VTNNKLAFQKATPEALEQAQKAVAIPSLEHLKRWLLGTNRKFIIFRSEDLLDAFVAVPHAASDFQQLVNLYTSQRLTKPSGEVKRTIDPRTKQPVEEPLFKDDRLTVEELDQAIRQLTREMYDRNPEWKL